MKDRIDVEEAGKLLAAVAEICDTYRTLAERRQALLEYLIELLDAKSGHWVWGFGREESERRTGMGFIPSGYSEAELKAFLQFATDADVQQELQWHLTAHLRRNPRSDHAWTVAVSESFANAPELPRQKIADGMRAIGVTDWLQAGRYVPNGTFTVLVIGRGDGQPAFNERDQA